MTSHFYWWALSRDDLRGLFMMPFYYGIRGHSVPDTCGCGSTRRRAVQRHHVRVDDDLFQRHLDVRDGPRLLRAALGWTTQRQHRPLGAHRARVHLRGGLTARSTTRSCSSSSSWRGSSRWCCSASGGRRVDGPPGEARPGWRPARASSPARGRVVEVHGQPQANPMGVEWFGMAMGLGFVLSFGYWCTDFLVIQRAMAANSMNAARRTPLIAAIPKMLFRSSSSCRA